ncbi:MAG: DNA polymerase III subunit alpha [Chloroflexi bacterium]|nr:DNA polymerase III subunit alpha [Chloroflexota bacterium]
MFAHLHTHTEYSELDGLSKIETLAERAKALGQEALAITDHGNLYGAVEFYQACEDSGIRPVLGMEAYVAPGDRRDRSDGREAASNSFHLVLLAQNQVGWRNLIQLSTRGHLEGFYYRPRVDRELLAAHSEGIIVLSGCPSSELQRALQREDLAEAHRVIDWYREVFDDRYYFEIQRHDELPQFEPQLRQTVSIAEELGVPLVATQDAHYCEPGDHDAHDLLLCIGTNAVRTDEKRFRFDGEDFYLTSEQYMLENFNDLPEAVTNTQLVAERCEVKLEFDRLRLPQPDIPEGKTALQHLSEIAYRGLEQRYGHPPQSHRDRLAYELHVIEETGFAEYFLIVMDFAHFARDRGIARAVRGSAAASLVLYCLDITDIDPMAHDLVFERFLNLERREMPDIDMDFADNRRDEVIRYVAEKYGRDRVAQIITFGTLGAKAAIRDSGRALGVPLGDTDRVARMVPNQLNISVEHAISQSQDLQQAKNEDSTINELLQFAQRLNGVVRNTSTHAAGVVISQEPLAENVPLRRPVNESSDEDWIPMTQWGMDEVAAVGLLKMDFLGLTNLTILEEAVALCREHERVEVDYVNLADGDEKTFEMLATGDTFGVFQLESGGMRRVVEDLKPTSIRDLAALLALYRPGPMEHIPRFIESKHGRVAVTYPHDDLGEILDDTYGVIVYQDQVLHIARKFAGYTLGQADVMRKAMGKKIASVMKAQRGKFLEGALSNGYSEQDAETIFELIEPFAGYAFNKAHAVSYAAIAYQTAWFKANYPAPYMAAVLRAAAGNSDRVREAAAECGRLGIPLLLPDVNRSEATFTLEKMADGRSAIRFGLGTIKNVGWAAVEPLIEERKRSGPILNASDLAERLDSKSMNRRAMEALAKAGAFDSIESRGAMVTAAADIIKRARRAQELRDSGQTSMFDLFGTEVATPAPTVELEEGVDATHHEQLNWERELLGAYVSEHPLQAATRALQGRVDAQLSELTEEMAGNTQTVAGLVNGVRQLTTRKGDPFAAVMLEDLSGTAEVTVWPDQWALTKQIWEPNQIVVTTVSIRTRMDRLTLAVQSVEPWSDQMATPSASPVSGAGEPLGGAGAVVIPAIKQAPPPPWMSKPREPLHLTQAGREEADAEEPAAIPTPATKTSPDAAASALWITIDESGDEAADRQLMEQLEGGLTAMKMMHVGEDPIFLRIRSGDRVDVLVCSDEWRLKANDQVVQVVSGALGERGSVRIAEPPDTVRQMSDSAAGL